jgi:ubiquitin carboxyl-terminal hydrolase 5/13
LRYETGARPWILSVAAREAHSRMQREEPPKKISKLAIEAETEEDRYDTKTFVKCFECGVDNVDVGAGKLPVVVEGVLKAATFARKAEVKAWEQEMVPCEHTLRLQQEEGRRIQSQGMDGKGEPPTPRMHSHDR